MYADTRPAGRGSGVGDGCGVESTGEDVAVGKTWVGMAVTVGIGVFVATGTGV
ncbi:MAG: hypothetical protein O6922_07240 [Chloroflexi bacterium]|nr:hypothetical protein [Chloroflexota bacterium]